MNPQEKAKDKRQRQRYNQTLEMFEAKKHQQGDKCAICDRSFAEYIAFQDHDHLCCRQSKKGQYCGKCNRGLLCMICNRKVIGIIERFDVDVARVLDYLTKWKVITWLGREQERLDKDAARKLARSKRKPKGRKRTTKTSRPLTTSCLTTEKLGMSFSRAAARARLRVRLLSLTGVATSSGSSRRISNASTKKPSTKCTVLTASAHRER